MKTLDRCYGFLLAVTSCLLLFLGQACTKEEVVDERPDFTFQGTLTDISDGSPKTDWIVSLRELPTPVFPIPDFVFINSFGYETVDSLGEFKMDVNSFSDLVNNEGFGFENTPEDKLAYYQRHELLFRPPGSFSEQRPNERDFMVLDPGDIDLSMETIDFSVKGESVVRNIEVYTGDRGRVRYNYEIEQEAFGEDFFQVGTTFRDLAFERPFSTLSPYDILGFIESDVEYSRSLYLPVNRPVEAVTTFRTARWSADNSRLFILDSLVFRDTFLLQSAADTLQQRSYTY